MSALVADPDEVRLGSNDRATMFVMSLGWVLSGTIALAMLTYALTHWLLRVSLLAGSERIAILATVWVLVIMGNVFLWSDRW